MYTKTIYLRKALSVFLILISCSLSAQETNLKNLTQLTFGGDNAEAYFAPDSKSLTMQVTNPEIGAQCDQIYRLELNKDSYSTEDLQLISTGLGRTTCSFYMPDGKHILYASTHEGGPECPPKPDPRPDGKYIWPIYPEFDIYVADLEGNIVKKLTNREGYDAEAVLSPDGKHIVFTSTRSGDLDLWIMDTDGNNKRQLTFELGYDGGAFFSHDSKKLIFRSSRPKTPEEIKEYKDLLAEGLVVPTQMEIYTMNIDGTGLRQITNLGKANWAPYFHPSDEKFLFSSNHHSTRGYDFQIFMMDLDGTNLRQVTYESQFNSFPMFSPDGKKLVFSSNRNGAKPHDTNVFIADWVDTDEAEYVNENNLRQTISYLASEELEGRLTGSKGEELAANYIFNNLNNLGLSPKYQSFDYFVKLNPHSDSESVSMTGKNVIAYLDNKSDKTIIIGAHYDHLGRNEHHNSTEPNSQGKIHYGADDNASGVAAVLELAKMYTQNQTIENANYVFAFFSGEEDGLIGSKKFAENVKEKYPNVTAMINLDMVGRMNDEKVLTVGGVGTSPIFESLVEKMKPAGVNLAIDKSGVGPSDHTSFYLQEIPVLFMFTGTHTDYHKPSDVESKINYKGISLIANYVFNLSNAIAKEDKLPFSETKIEQTRAVPKYKVTMGVMPSYADSTDGMLIDGVMDNQPASKAGLKAGDKIQQIGSCEVKEIYSYMDCLAEINAGEKHPVTVERNNEKLVLEVEF